MCSPAPAALGPNLRVVEGWDGPKKPTHGDLMPTNMTNETHMRATWTMNLQKKIELKNHEGKQHVFALIDASPGYL